MKKRGFSLIELLIVVAIIAVLVGTAILYIYDNVKQARRTKVAYDQESIFLACHKFRQLRGIIPMSIGNLTGQYLQDEILDPWGNPYLLSFGYILCGGEDGVYGTEDDIMRSLENYDDERSEAAAVASRIVAHIHDFEAEGSGLFDNIGDVENRLRNENRGDTEVPVDPWGGDYEIDGDDLISPGPDRDPGTGDDVVVPIRDSTTLACADFFNHKIKIVKGSGETVSEFGSLGAGAGQFNQPAAVAMSGGSLYVAEQGNHRIQVLDSSGNHQSFIGGSGTGNGQFNRPRGVAIKGSLLAVADMNNNRVQLLSTAGAYVRQKGGFSQPSSVRWGPDGNLYVAATWNNTIVVLDESFNTVRSFGNGKATRDVAFKDGQFYVATENHTVEIFNAAGGHLGSFGTAVTSPQNSHYYRIGVDSKGRIWVNASDGRVEAWAEGSMTHHLFPSGPIGGTLGFMSMAFLQ